MLPLQYKKKVNGLLSKNSNLSTISLSLSFSPCCEEFSLNYQPSNNVTVATIYRERFEACGLVLGTENGERCWQVSGSRINSPTCKKNIPVVCDKALLLPVESYPAMMLSDGNKPSSFQGPISLWVYAVGIRGKFNPTDRQVTISFKTSRHVN